MAAYPRFLGGSYTAQSPLADQELTINFYPERQAAPGEQPHYVLYPTPGVTTLSTTTGTQGRASFVFKNRCFAVISASFGEIDASGTFTAIGTVAIDQYPATISTNGDGGGQIFVTSGNNGYIYDLTSLVFSQVRTGATRMGKHLDGYFLALDVDTSTLFLSDLLDGTTWDPTQFAQRSIRPDPWVSVEIVDRYIWLLGSETSEVWYNAGTFPFPFAPHPSGLLPFGCAASFSPVVVAGSLMWLGQTRDGSGQVIQAQGFTPTPVSTAALEVAFASYATLADAIADTYQALGHTFYVLTLPQASHTHVWDLATGMWHDRGTWLAGTHTFEAWRPAHHVFVFERHLVLDRASGIVGELSSAVFTDVESRPIRRVRRAPMIVSEDRVFASAFELQLESGMGVTAGQGQDPQVSLRVSKDGGKTFGNEHWRSAGKRGEYTKRVRWTRLGMSEQAFVLEIAMTDPIPWRLVGSTFLRRGGGQTGRKAAA